MLQYMPIHSPLFLDLRDAIIAGSTGRMAMILLIYIGPFIRLPRIDVVSMLGSLAASSKEAAVTLGGAIHFSLGILFAIIYAALWTVGIGGPTWYWGIVFGTVHGLLVIIMLLVARQMFPLLSQHFNTLTVMIAILLNHIVFGLVVAVVYTS
jgi:hypothetical protein